MPNLTGVHQGVHQMTTPYGATTTPDLSNKQTEFETAVNDVIETMIDGVRGFDAAADKADGDLGQQLASMGAQRREAADDMIRVASDENMDPITLDDQGTPSGVLHRSWISIRDAVQGDSGVAAAALNGEQHAKKQLEEALDKGLPKPIATVARRALGEIEENISNLEPLTS